MRMTRSVVTACLGLLFISPVRAALIADFESPTYTAGTSFAGVDGWVSFTATERVTPDPLGSGATAVLTGSQSAYISGVGGRAWGSAVSGITGLDFYVSALVQGPGIMYFSDNASGGTSPAGVRGFGSTFYIHNGIVDVNTGIPFNSSDVFRMTMHLQTTGTVVGNTMTPTFENITLGTPPVTGSTYAFTTNPGADMTLAGLQANGGITMAGEGIWDNFEVYTPEPASLALLGVGGAMLLRRMRRA